MERIARDPRYFAFLTRCAPEAKVVLGDARLSLADASPGTYDIIVLDAYSSDAIPMHLITREALALYLDKLNEGGLLAFHISNRYFDLKPVLANLTRNAGLVALAQKDIQISLEEKQRGKSPSEWVVVARHPSDLTGLNSDARWQPLEARRNVGLWTDDFSSILHVWKWR